MVKVAFASLAFLLVSHIAALRDVPVGECHMCEVTCLEDCSLKYDREIMQTDFLQAPDESNKNFTIRTKLGQQYSDCLIADKCPCAKEEAKAALAAGKKALLQSTNKSCAVQQAPCAMQCAEKVLTKAHAAVDGKQTAVTETSKKLLLQREYPIHSVQVGVFAKGHMNLNQCHKFCLAATCGCDKAPGLKTIDQLFKAIKANDAAEPGEKDFSHRGEINNRLGGAVVDTHASYRFRPAKMKECAKGMIGKKINKNLYIDMGSGVGGEIEICSPEFFEKLFGPGDHKKQEGLCASGKSEDTKWGCVWNDVKNYCMVGISENLRCQVKYIRDPSRF